MRAGLHRFFLMLLLAALPFKGIAAVLMPGCAAMASLHAAAPVDAAEPMGLPCHAGAADEAAMTTASGETDVDTCCTCGPCLAPMLALGVAVGVPCTDRVEARPLALLTPAPDADGEVPRPPPRG